MEVERDRVVRFHYVLSDEAGERLGSSRESEPVAMLHGHGNVIPGLEAALAGRSAGDRFRITVASEEAYGPRLEGHVRRVQRKRLARAKRLKPGDETLLRTAEGLRRVTVLKVGRTVADVDLNHPLAGRNLVFDIEILEVRAAEPEEIAHGHVHGPGGHRH